MQGKNPWDRQVINEGFGIQQGFKYKLTFKAKAEKSRKVGLGIGWVDAAANYEWHGFFGARVDLTPEEQEFTFTFDATEASYAEYSESRLIWVTLTVYKTATLPSHYPRSA
ncbi:carbohydrate binding domain-containing protein [Paenibacillus amylolyticus]|nr:carbohydrate binding domain-containing protein [Paenibacillus amylolyticus]